MYYGRDSSTGPYIKFTCLRHSELGQLVPYLTKDAVYARNAAARQEAAAHLSHGQNSLHDA